MSRYFRGHDRPQSRRKEQRSARCHRFDTGLLLRPSLMLSQLNSIDATYRISPDRLDTSKCNFTQNLGRSCRYCKMRLTSRLYIFGTPSDGARSRGLACVHGCQADMT
jgi:hypothetical protein